MGFLTRLFEGIAPPPSVTRSHDYSEFPSFETQLDTVARRALNSRPWTMPTIREALSVPSVFRAVSLLANTAGSLPIQAFRNGELMSEAPALVRRPDPNTTRRRFIRQTVWSMATRGEAFWYITARDPDEKAAALLHIPPNEVRVEWDTRKVRRVYYWREREMMPGQMRHLTYVEEDGALRGVGPLQLCGAAVSSSIEATEWAASFFAEGGVPSINLHSAVELDENEANSLRDKWLENAGNTARVTSGPLELRPVQVNPQEAQLLEARMASVGDVARMFGIPAHLLSFSQPGSSLTYQNLDMVAVELVRFGLGIGYLEPIEDELSDLMTRSTTAQFWVDGIQRADVRTRWDTYEKAVAVLGQEDGAAYAREREGLVPGNPNTEPVPSVVTDAPNVPEAL